MINVAIVGVGNCASALVQGVEYYRRTGTSSGLIIPQVFGMSVSDIEFVAAFDIDTSKVGRPLSTGIFSGRNNTLRIVDSVESNCIVSPCPLLDGVGTAYQDCIDVVAGSDEEVRRVLHETRPDVLVNYLPVGSDEATRYWAELCLELKIGFVNAIPSFIASDPQWRARFIEAGVACAGDDVKSQIGATILHRALVKVFVSRGGELADTYQLNFGGNMDFMNMTEDRRLDNKRTSKKNSVLSVVDSVATLDKLRVHISPTDFVSYLRDNKIAYINLRGTGFGGAPVEIETKISVWDSLNSAAIIVDVVRFVAGAMHEGVGGALPICDFYFKSPPEQQCDIAAETKAREYALAGTFRPQDDG